MMRKKRLFLSLLAIFALISLSSCNYLKFIANQRDHATQNNLNIAPQPTSGYVNSLLFRIGGAYELTFNSNFTQAQVKIDNQLLNQPAYIRIFNKKGQLLAGEYTVAVEPSTSTLADDTGEDSPVQPVQYRFVEQTKSYTVDLEPGYTIEIATPEGYFVSSLSGKVAASYAPTNSPETYVVMPFGLRKNSWSVQRGETEMYNLVRDYFVSALSEYQAEISDEALHNKNYGTTEKAQAVVAFYQLRAADQAQFTDFIDQLRRGGAPVITYSGKNEYTIGSRVDLASLVSAQDAEDGEINHIEMQTSADFNKAGTYDVVYSAIDSDKNRTDLTVRITVVSDGSDVIHGSVGPESSAQQAWGSLGSLLPNSIANLSQNLAQEENYSYIAPEAEPSADSEDVSDNQSTDSVAKPSQTTTQLTAQEAQVEDADKKSGLTFWQITIGAVVTLIILGLIRFISDHYVR